MSTLPELERDPRSRIRRYSQLQSYDRQALYDLLDEAYIAHIGFPREDGVGVIPMGYARDGETLLLHGSTRAGVLRAGTDEATITATVTLLDGFVYAATLYDSTFNFRSATVTGAAHAVTDPEEKEAALELLSERIMPGRWAHVPPLTAQQSAATLVMRLAFDVVSLKVRTGPPDDAEPGELWTGVVPWQRAPGVPEAQPGCASDVPDYVVERAG